MKKDLSGGSLLILGSVLSVIVMGFHPSGMDLDETFRQQALTNRLVHGVAIAALPMILLGLLAARRSIGGPDLATAGVVTYSFTAGTWTLAAIASGFIQTELYGRMLVADPEQLALYEALSAYTHIFNQACALIGVVASAATIALFSGAIVRNKSGHLVGAYMGLLISAIILIAVLPAKLTLNVHGFGMVILLQSAWFIWLGTGLIRASEH